MFISSLVTSITEQKCFQDNWRHSSFFITKWFYFLVVWSLSRAALLEPKKTFEYLMRCPATVTHQQNFMFLKHQLEIV